MTHNYLLEIGIEEIPAHIVTPSINQLKKRVTDFLKDNKLAFDSIDSFSDSMGKFFYRRGFSQS